MGQAAGGKRADGSDCTLSGLLTPAAPVSSENPRTHITGEKSCWSKGMHPSLSLAAGRWPWVFPENCLPLGSCILKKTSLGRLFSPAQPIWFCKLISPAFPWSIHGPQSRGHRDKPSLGLSQLVIAAQFPVLCKAPRSSASLPPKLARPGTSGTLWRRQQLLSSTGRGAQLDVCSTVPWINSPPRPGDLQDAQTS